MQSEFFHEFDQDISDIALPDQFTYPFYYQPHELIKLAAKKLQRYLSEQTELQHNFGLDDTMSGLVIGKMFGVLLVRSESEEIGFLAAFSGKLGDSNHIKGFVPSIFDMLQPDGFYKIEEANISQLTLDIIALEEDIKYQKIHQEIISLEKEKQAALSEAKQKFREGRSIRKQERQKAKIELTTAAYEVLHEKHKKTSLEQQHQIKWLTYNWTQKIDKKIQLIAEDQQKIKALKSERKKRSAALQEKLFEQYNFLNNLGNERNVKDIFSERFIDPPSGSGECAAPKLLNYAYKNKLTPLAIGEFWWGASPKSEVRRHGHFYPSCKRKCDPILSHMLIGLDVEENPLAVDNGNEKTLEILYEDKDLLVINKPHDFLSVPGKQISDSVQTRMEEKFPNEKGHLIIHRLDMSTSGLMVISKNKDSHKKLQAAFINRTINKRYTAILDGEITTEEGEISLPLRVDLDDRPRQLVCYEHGKPAKTIWRRVQSVEQGTLVHFYPITGRTHQLRLHAAHADGLNTPILGDDLYGISNDRLYLHASFLKFEHPSNGKTMTFHSKAPFEK